MFLEEIQSKNFETPLKISKEQEKCVPQESWFSSLLNTFRRYKLELFGGGDSEIRAQRMHDYAVKPSFKFVFAKYRDGFYRPGAIVGRNKKLQTFVISFYHNRKCFHTKPVDILLKHGNLLNYKVSFGLRGRKFKGKVYGNNAPANKGFPTIFYVKKKDKWFKIPFRQIFLTKKQFNKFFFDDPPKHRYCDKKSELDSITNDVKFHEPCTPDNTEFISNYGFGDAGDAEMSEVTDEQ